MSKRKSDVTESNRDATPTSEQLAASMSKTEPSTPAELRSDALASDPALDNEQAVANAVAVLVRNVGSSDHRIVRRKVKVGGVWYVVEVARP